MPLPSHAPPNRHISPHPRFKSRSYRSFKRPVQTQKVAFESRFEPVEDDNVVNVALSSPPSPVSPLGEEQEDARIKYSKRSCDTSKTHRTRNPPTPKTITTQVAKPKASVSCLTPATTATTTTSSSLTEIVIDSTLPNHFLQPARPRLIGVGPIARHLGTSTPFVSQPQVHRPSYHTRRVQMKKDDSDKSSSELSSIAALSPVPRSTSPSSPPKPISRLPDLNAIVPRPPPVPSPTSLGHNGLPATKAFSLLPPPYTDADIPLPRPYNAAYPHPLTAYASPGVNPASVYHSGYGIALMRLIEADPHLIKGGILAASERVDIAVPSLTLCLAEGEGNGIPERLWSRFESFGAARLPIGLPASPAYPRTTPGRTLPPRFSMTADTLPTTWTTSSPSQYGAYTSQPDVYNVAIDNSGDCSAHELRHASSAIEMHREALTAQYFARSRSETALPSMDHHHGGSSPWHKTELCRGWIETGGCRYGAGCQFAHGLDELRHSLSQSSEPLYARKASLPGLHQSQTAYNPAVRRASAPPANLAVVPEMEDDLHYLYSYETLATPLDRYNNTPTHDSGHPGDRLRKTVSWLDEDNEDSAWLVEREREQEQGRANMITPRQSSSSLSTSSSSRGSLWTNTSPAVVHAGSEDEWYGLSPADSVGSLGWRERRESDKADTQGLTSLEFSTGRSIWC
ncbi:hypothetical protein BCR39DRAFT_505642 [Naematelia encephala]|uniref:C3H1-type domain-containing protein n=1 Tax=Naematelia encephala TaxID=71784 RepID=A0A1Y2B3V6_9TREE|nr:hypothetical protein BCR39DRAFT_505642 [Naematelia encephala]